MDFIGLKAFLMDDDVENRLLIRNPYVAPSLVAAYVIFVAWIGPEMMKNRKPFKIVPAMIVYNSLQCAFNLFVAYHIISFAIRIWPDHCDMKRQPRMPEHIQSVLKLVWWIYLSKFLDFFDTIFFILRKKNAQVSFLHVFHHGLVCMIFAIMLNLKEFGYYIIVTLSINTVIHVIMYFYYALTCLGPHMQKYLWWKKYLTTIQIVQFVIDLSFLIGGFITGCEDRGPVELFVTFGLSSLLILFVKFYFKSYKTQKKAA